MSPLRIINNRVLVSLGWRLAVVPNQACECHLQHKPLLTWFRQQVYCVKDRKHSEWLSSRACMSPIAVRSRGEVCPMPYALCPMPYALCQIVPHVTEKGYTFSRAPITYFLWAVMPIDFWGLRPLIRAIALFARSTIAFTPRAANFSINRWLISDSAPLGKWSMTNSSIVGNSRSTLTFFIPVFGSAFWHILKHISSKFTILINKNITLCTDI